MNEALKAQIQVVAIARIAAKERIDVRNAARLQWESEHKEMIDFATLASAFVVAEETKLREMTLDIFHATQDKHPAPEVGIREMDKLDYMPANAMKWALDHTLALKLDTGAFEKIVKASPAQFDFVKIEKVATATIASEIKLEE